MIIIILVFGWVENVPSNLDSSPGRSGRGCLRAAWCSSVWVISVLCQEEIKLLELHKSSPRALMAFLGIPGFVPTLRQLQGLGLAGRASSEHHFPLGTGAFVHPENPGQDLLVLTSLPSPDPAVPCPCKTRIQPRKREIFGNSHRQLLLLLPNVQEMSLMSPVGWQ